MSESQENLHASGVRFMKCGPRDCMDRCGAREFRKLEDKADGLIYGLRRASNKARSLERAAGHPMAIGFSACPRRASPI